MSVTNAAVLANLQASALTISAILAQEAAYQLNNPGAFGWDYSIDGESYSKTSWRQEMQSRLKDLETQIQRWSGPWVVTSRLRS